MSNPKKALVPVSKKLMAVISDAVQNEYAVRPLVGTGHVKSDMLFDKLILTVEFDASKTEGVEKNRTSE